MAVESLTIQQWFEVKLCPLAKSQSIPPSSLHVNRHIPGWKLHSWGGCMGDLVTDMLEGSVSRPPGRGSCNGSDTMGNYLTVRPCLKKCLASVKVRLLALNTLVGKRNEVRGRRETLHHDFRLLESTSKVLHPRGAVRKLPCRSGPAGPRQHRHCLNPASPLGGSCRGVWPHL